MRRSVKYIILLLSCAYLTQSCQSVKKSYQRIAADLAQIESYGIDDFSTPDSLHQAMLAVASLLQEAEDLLPEGDPRRLEHPFSPILNRLTQYQSYLLQFQSDPSLYNIGGHLQLALSQNEKPESDQLARCEALLTKAPDYYQDAKVKITKPDSAKLELAIQKQIRSLQLIEDEYAKIQHSLVIDQQQTVIQACRYALKDYIAWCNSQLIEQSQ